MVFSFFFPYVLLQIQARALSLDRSDPYVAVTVGAERKKTGVIKNNLNPKWENEFLTSTLLNGKAGRLIL